MLQCSRAISSVHKPEEPMHCCLLTVMLWVLRSALFPIPLAFESTGIIAALIAMIVVAAATIYTVELLMSQATATGMHDYETLSLAVGGFWYKVTTAYHCPVHSRTFTAPKQDCRTARATLWWVAQRLLTGVPLPEENCSLIDAECSKPPVKCRCLWLAYSVSPHTHSMSMLTTRVQ